MGMCGPIALMLPVNRSSKATMLGGVAVYNLGRVFSYAAMGVLFGMIGKGFVLAVSQNTLSVLSGVLILMMVVFPHAVNRIPVHHALYAPLERVKQRMRKLFGVQSMQALFSIGLLNGLLPCGMVYIALAASMATGTSLSGMLFMAGFGLGTLPAMVAVTFSKAMISVPVMHKIRRVVPVLVSVTACLLILRGMSLGIPYVSPSVQPSGTIGQCCTK